MATDERRQTYADGDARDAELLAAGDFWGAVERHFEALRMICRVRAEGDTNREDELLTRSMERLEASWQNGGLIRKVAETPFRVIVLGTVCFADLDVHADRTREAERVESVATVPDDHARGGREHDIGQRVVASSTWRRYLAGLAPRDGECLMMALAGWSAREIGDRLGISGNAVNQAVHRAKRQLRTMLERDDAY